MKKCIVVNDVDEGIICVIIPSNSEDLIHKLTYALESYFDLGIVLDCSNIDGWLKGDDDYGLDIFISQEEPDDQVYLPEYVKLIKVELYI